MDSLDPTLLHCTQTVTENAGSWHVEAECAVSTAPPSEKLVFHPDKPWYEVLDDQGNLVNEIVETGVLSE